MEQNENKERENKTNSECTSTIKIICITINVFAIVLLAIITHVVMKNSIFHNKLLIIVSCAVALSPVLSFFIKNEKYSKIICCSSTVIVLILCIMLYSKRKVSIGETKRDPMFEDSTEDITKEVGKNLRLEIKDSRN